MATTYSITGTIYDPSNKPLKGVTIIAKEIDFRDSSPVGKPVTTDAKGFYSISFSDEGDINEYHRPDVLIEIGLPGSKETVASLVYYNIEENVVIDYYFRSEGGNIMNEFDRLEALLLPMIQPKKIRFDQLEESSDDKGHKDISFLSGDTGEDFEVLQAFINAHKLAYGKKIPVPFFYALLRDGQSNDVVELLELDKTTLKTTIENAVSAKIVPSSILANVDKLNDEFKAETLKEVVDKKLSPKIQHLERISSKILKDTKRQQILFEALYVSDSDTEDFWDVLSKKPEFKDKEIVSRLKNTFEIDRLFSDQAELSISLVEHFSSNNKSYKSLAAWSPGQWKDQIKKAKVTTFPEYVRGDNKEEKLTKYAELLSNQFRFLFPTNYISGNLIVGGNSAFEKSDELKRFFERNPDYEITATDFLKKFDDSMDKDGFDAVTLKQNIKSLNRLLKITDIDYNAINVLKEAKLDSAASIARKYGSKSFAKEFSVKLGNVENAIKYYKRAASIDKKATAVAVAYQMSNDIRTPVTHNKLPITNSSTSSDGTIAKTNGETYHTMFNDSELCDCDHCQSVYSPAAYFVDMLSYLKGENTGAFDALIGRRPDLQYIELSCKNTNTVLPYIDLVNELLEMEVIKLNPNPDGSIDSFTSFQTEGDTEVLDAIPEHTLPKSYYPLKGKLSEKSGFSNALPFDEAFEQVKLYLDKLGWPQYDFIKRFGSKDEDIAVASGDRLIQLAYAWFGSSVSTWNVVSDELPFGLAYDHINDHRLDTLLPYMRITYRELRQLLECRFLNPIENNKRNITIEQDDTAIRADGTKIMSCNLEQLFLSSLSEDWLIKTARFIRLWKITGWDLYDLDRALMTLELKNFPDKAEFNSKTLIQFYLLDVLRKEMKLSISQALVLISDIVTDDLYRDFTKDDNPVQRTLYQSLFENDPLKKLDTSLPLDGNKEFLCAAYNIAARDFENYHITDNISSIPQLSKIYRQVLVAKYLNVSFEELHKILKISLSTIEINDIWKLIDVNQLISDTALLKKIDLEADRIIALSNTTEEEKDIVRVVLELLKKVDAFTNNPIGASFEAGFKDELNQLNDFLTSDPIFTTNTSEEVKNIKAIFYGITGSEIEKTSKLTLPEVQTLQLELSKKLRLIPTSKILMYFNFSDEDLLWVKEKGPALKIMDFWLEKVTIDSIDLFSSIKQLYFLSQLAKRKKQNTSTKKWTDLIDLLLNQNDDGSAQVDLIKDLYGINVSLIKKVLGIQNVSIPASIRDIEMLISVLDRAEVLNQLGPTEDQVKNLLKNEPDGEETKTILNLLKSKHTASEWLKAIRPINDKLRKKRRDALVSWLLDKNTIGWEKPADIYKYLLIDTEMESCMDTSRIKQAISSIQLYIDRLLMGLEEDAADEEFATQWNTWRKQYRVWEANRKIFLYPENWLEPELRDNKSPFFKELESQLTQNEITDETAKEALITYLQKLDNVAILEIVGFFNDESTGKLHVIGRTHNIPQQYFYRYQYKEVWSAWEKVEVDIEGDHILPIVWNGRLMLFWAQFTEKQENNGNTSISGSTSNMTMSSTEGSKYYEMKLAWSEYKNGKWSGKKVSKDAIEIGKEKEMYNIDKKELPILINKFFISSFIYKSSSLHIILYQESFDSPYKMHNCGSFKLSSCNSLIELEPITTYIPLTQGQLDPLSYDSNSQLHRLRIKGMMQIRDNQFNNPKGHIKIDFGNFFKDELKEFKLDEILNYNEQTILNSKKHNLLDEITQVFFISNTQKQFFIQNKSFEVYLCNYGLENTPNTLTTYSLKSENEHSSNKYVISLNSIFNRIKRIRAYSFYHTKICDIINFANSNSIKNIYSRNIQDKINHFFKTEYSPSDFVMEPYPVEDIDYSTTGAYSNYNWELFIHIPLTIASQFINNQKFDEARKWLHYIFNPTEAGEDSNNAKRFWVPRVFRDEIDRMVSLEKLLQDKVQLEDFIVQVENWEENPFNPNAVARFRISAYMRKTYLLYIDNLIKWGDQLFAKDTIESINEATLMYVLASEILGERMQSVPPREKAKAATFANLNENLDAFSNTLVDTIETYINPSTNSEDNAQMYYFGLPKNEYILKYWDTIEERLYKIRHCMNIQGVVRSLALFEPPLDPAMLIRMRAAGLTLGDVMDQSFKLPNSRFYVMLQKANELCNDIKGLGASILSAIEKKDAEQLSLLHSTHELNMLALVKRQKEMQRDEVKENLGSMVESKNNVEFRSNFFKNRDYRNSSEKQYFLLSQTANTMYGVSQLNSALAALLHLLPEIKIGSGFTIGFTSGGANLGNATKVANDGYNSLINALKTGAEMANLKASFQRRDEDWDYQAKSAEIELKQIDKQIAANEIRLAMAEQDLVNHDRQTEQSREVDDYMRSKFSNAELYNWMVEQLSTIYFQTYNLAYATAKKAEVCMQHELGIEDSSFIQFGYWDSLKKGLLSGEKLQFALRLLENAYNEQNSRELEITKHISLKLLHPTALISLRETGECNFEIPEVLFDMDFPGHYRRRIKSVSISIPCIAGPYTPVNATLSLVSSKYRKTASADAYPEKPANSDNRFVYSNGSSIQSIATSHGQNDSGLFELNFRDDRYLPFEGCGVISTWKLTLPTEIMQFDYNTISDLIVHIRYTAVRDDSLVAKVNNNLVTQINSIKQELDELGIQIAYNLKRDFPREWHQLRQDGAVSLKLDEIKLPYFLFNLNAKISSCSLLTIAQNQPGINIGGEPQEEITDSIYKPGSQPTNKLFRTKKDKLVKELKIIISDTSELDLYEGVLLVFSAIK